MKIVRNLWALLCRFAGWYWRGLKAIPLVAASFALGGCSVGFVVAISVHAPSGAALEKGLRIWLQGQLPH